jgi:hypothetical protein
MNRLTDRLFPGLAIVVVPAILLWLLGYLFTARMLAVVGGGIWIIIPPPHRSPRRALSLLVFLGGLSFLLDVLYWRARNTP